MISRFDIVQEARRHVGLREESENDGPQIRLWLRRCQVFGPAPWCAAFASHCLDLDRPFVSALALGRHFPRTSDPKPGDVMFFATDDRGHGHCGIVVQGDERKVLCIEGNSANSVRHVIRMRSEVQFGETNYDDGMPLLPITTDAPLVHVQKEGTR